MKRYKLNHYYIVQVGEQHPYSMSVGSNGKGWLYEHRHVMEQKLGRILERARWFQDINLHSIMLMNEQHQTEELIKIVEKSLE